MWVNIYLTYMILASFGQIMKLMSTYMCANFYRDLRDQLGIFGGQSPPKWPREFSWNRKKLAAEISATYPCFFKRFFLEKDPQAAI